ncbi:hypothetical protein A2470_00130 [Candidatus Curtissbacteria bacterium RIFOXYC2_FULL_41_11]|uniref:Metallo-beta-lactamase domain-containing protein n=1 Tax=Candidatus Curtissbacteria bacterium RIFOXYA1_FULL_41_14 TaxID=1797737 RepID=A0A1F5HF39_9BACT|nr:MAG: internalization-related competence protein ComEC/Rec2 protein [Candidatus Curtissbacteria bacterium GW2011_GWB1_40_28]KKS00682.1 MAG: internalization-related competence protein ComEC/Rec2 protein [Candidatus Curtissbacteria bacterium GW2011_GWC2_41_21]OGE02662.1 MAG: hypothetical protein A2196_05520 [Candidatus Curtissbacteria bacterium RIFOXYA1_FULL_41_14]OGE10627.1 MAG: hypothetical protein A2470_00130 [Candidatus Curtissbacteria bacterium RIFOXYC2_FULL_41_11]OGE13492.1 MAG: hypotheti
MDFKAKLLLTSALFFAVFGFLLIFQSQNSGKFRLIACDVGQGDGILLVSPGGKQVLIDGGPGTKVVDCLGQKMPFWDRTVEMVVSTHPEKDHLEGLLEVLARYKVKMVVTTGVVNDTELFKAWKEAIRKEGAKIYFVKAGDRLVLDSIRGRTSSMDVLWPTAEKLALWKLAGLTETNESSVVMKVNFGQFCAYLTGDIPKEILESLINKSCQVLKISHHGSKTGTSEQILDSVHPIVTIIQVGRNSFGHPHKEVIDLLESKVVTIYRNDSNGIIEISSDGKSFKVKSERKTID